MQTVIVKQGQDILDIAIIYCGDVNLSHQIAVQNGISVSDILQVGESLLLPDVAKKNIVSLFTEKHQPATGWKPDSETPEQKKGIGQMQIGTSFKVD